MRHGLDSKRLSKRLFQVPNLAHPSRAFYQGLPLAGIALKQVAIGYDVAGNGTRLSEGFGNCNAGSDRYLDDFGGRAWGSGAAGE
jgi:hypothetical protein